MYVKNYLYTYGGLASTMSSLNIYQYQSEFRRIELNLKNCSGNATDITTCGWACSLGSSYSELGCTTCGEGEYADVYFL